MRLIDADNLETEVWRVLCLDCCIKHLVPCNECKVRESMKRIADAPTIEAEPVRHGRWEVRHVRPVGGLYTDYCSECGEAGRDGMIYCPWCGAKMDGGAKDG